MKIIGNAAEHYILRVSKEEMANIMGLSSSYVNDFHKKVDNAAKNQTDIKVSDIYRKHHSLEYLLKQKPFSDARKELNAMCERLKPIEALISGLPVVKDEE